MLAGNPTRVGSFHRGTRAGNLEGEHRRAACGGARADAPARRAALRGAAQHDLHADPQPAGLGPRPHRELRGALARPAGRGQGAARRRARPPLRRDREPARRPATSCRSCAAMTSAPTWPRCAKEPSRCSTRSKSTIADSDPRLAVVRLRDADRPRASAQRDDAPAPADGRRLRAAARRRRAARPSRSTPGPRWSRFPPGATRSAPPADGFAYDNERPRHEVQLDAFLIDRAPVTNGAFAEFVADTGAEPPMYWERDGEGGWVSTIFGRRDPIDPDLPVIHVDHAQASAFAALGGQAPADRVRVGGRRHRRRPRPRQPRPARLRRRARRRLRRRTLRLRRRADARRRLGVDLLDARRVPGLRGLPLSRVLRGLLRRWLPGPSRRRLGEPPQRDPHRASGTGTSPSGARSSPASAARETTKGER